MDQGGIRSGSTVSKSKSECLKSCAGFDLTVGGVNFMAASCSNIARATKSHMPSSIQLDRPTHAQTIQVQDVFGIKCKGQRAVDGERMRAG